MPIRLTSLAWTLCGLQVLAAETAPEPKLIDPKSLPANQWVERPLAGWQGKTWFGPGIHMGLCPAGVLGVLIFDGATVAGNGQPQDTGTVRIRRLDPASGTWSEQAAAPLAVAFRDKFNAGVVESLFGTQLCWDSERKMLVGLTSTGLDGRGRTVEFDLEAKTATGHQPEPSPPVVTAASLCYDPVNKEVVLATGGFSTVGGTEGTWLYSGAQKKWRHLETPQVVDEVRIPVEKARDRLLTLRWLAWKNLEFRATGRELLVDERSKGESLAKEAAVLAAELKKHGELAGVNAIKAERPYHKGCLASAQKLLEDAAGKLAVGGAKLKAGSPEEMETLYHGLLIPALEAVERAVSELAVTPEPRMSARLVYDSKNKRVICFGGDRQDGQWGDTWVYHCEGRWWERKRHGIHPPAMASRAVAFDPSNGLTVLLDDKTRLWAYDSATNEWRNLDIPGPRDAFWLEHDAAAGCLLAMNHDMNKAWLLRLEAVSVRVIETKTTPDTQLTPTHGEFVLRDAATVADMKKWKGETDKWAKSVPANTWVLAPTNGTGRPNWGRTWSSIVYDPDRMQIYYRDGGHGSYHGAVTDHYDLPTGRWFRSDRKYEPRWPMGSYFAWGRSFSGAPWCTHTYKYGLFYNPVTRSLMRSNKSAPPKKPNFFSYDPDTGVWAWETFGVPAPPGSDGWLPVFGTRANAMLIPRGCENSATGGLAEFTADGWRVRTDAGPFAPVGYPEWEFQTSQYDPKRNRILHLGPGPKANQLWSLDLGTVGAKWTRLEPRNEPERSSLPESGREMVYVPKYDVFIMPDGAKGKAMTEMCAFDPVENVWRRFEVKAGGGAAGLAKHLSSDRANGLAYDPQSDLCFFVTRGPSAPPMYAFRYVPEKAGGSKDGTTETGKP